MNKKNEEVVVCSFAFIFMSVASVAALFLTSEDEAPPQVYIPPAVATPMPTGRTFNHLYETPRDNFEDINPRVLEKQMQEWVDQQKFQRNPVKFAVEKLWEY